MTESKLTPFVSHDELVKIQFRVKNHLINSWIRNFTYIKSSLINKILICEFFYNKNFENNFFVHYFDRTESPKQTLKLPMNNFGNKWKLTLSLLFLAALTASVVMFQLKYHGAQALVMEERIAYIEVEETENYFATNEAFYFRGGDLIQDAEIPAQKATLGFIFPFNDPSSKNQLIIFQLIFALMCMLIATKFHIETRIYEFFNQDEKGLILFENSYAEITHNLTIYTGMIFKVIGISCGFLSLFVYVF